MYTVATWWMWVAFFIFVLFVMSIDFFLLGRKGAHRVSVREALFWTVTWVISALLFNFCLWYYLYHYVDPALANTKALEFFTGYLIEESLSVDNMFIFLMIFNYFSVPAHYRRGVLIYGVLGAMILRLLMILLGTWLIQQFHWILYIFGVFLIFSGIKLIFTEETKDLKDNFILKFLQRRLRVTSNFEKDHFFVIKNNQWFVTPLFLVLILIELTDLMFALDSIPAIFAITQDPFIVFTSNIFAILGLRALYFLVENLAERFYLLKYGIALMLCFIGTKMVLSYWISIPIMISLSVVVAILSTTIILSLLIKPRKHK